MQPLAFLKSLFIPVWIHIVYSTVCCDAIESTSVYGVCTPTSASGGDGPAGLIRYSRDQLYDLRRSKGKHFIPRLVELGIFYYRGCRGGRKKRTRMYSRGYAQSRQFEFSPSNTCSPQFIPVILSTRTSNRRDPPANQTCGASVNTHTL